MTLRFQCQIEGVGVDPDNPPLVWEAWTGEKWEKCELDRDTTGGINRDGDVVLHVPKGHVPFTIDRVRAGWLRARVTAAAGRPADLQRLARDSRPVRVHDRRHGRRDQRRAAT